MLIKICMNGGKLKEKYPWVPVTAEEYEKEIPGLLKEGISNFHIHFRGEDGIETLSQDAIEPQFRYLKEKFPECRIGIGSPLKSGRTAAIRAQQVSEWNWHPDYISLNICEEGSRELAPVLVEKETPIEWGVFTMEDAEKFVEWNCEQTAFRVLIEIFEGNGPEQRKQAEEIYHFLHSRYPNLEYLLHGFGQGTWEVIRFAKENGLPYRIGFEDTDVDENGNPIASNLELYRRSLNI